MYASESGSSTVKLPPPVIVETFCLADGFFVVIQKVCYKIMIQLYSQWICNRIIRHDQFVDIQDGIEGGILVNTIGFIHEASYFVVKVFPPARHAFVSDEEFHCPSYGGIPTRKVFNFV